MFLTGPWIVFDALLLARNFSSSLNFVLIWGYTPETESAKEAQATKAARRLLKRTWDANANLLEQIAGLIKANKGLKEIFLTGMAPLQRFPPLLVIDHNFF